MKLSARFKTKSISYLEHYITKKRCVPLAQWKEDKIKKIIEKKKQNLDKFVNEILKCPLYKLAEAEIIREGYKGKFILEGKERYEIPPSKTMLMMLNIVDVANRQGQKKRLNEYCRGF